MEQNKYIPAAIWVFGVVFIIYSLQYKMGTIRAPGNGFFPLVCAIGLACLSSVLLIKDIWLTPKKGNIQTHLKPLKESIHGGKLNALIVVLIFFALLHNILGYWVGVLISMVALMRIANEAQWKWCVFSSVVTTIVFYLIFEYCMGAYFPKGVIGF